MARALRWVAIVLAALAALSVVALYSTRAWYADGDQAPEAATGRREVELVRAYDYIVVAAHPLAAEAGHRILTKGGSAVDAAVAVQAMLTLVEPQSSGIGGGAFMLHYDPERGELDAFDGRETAPAKATPQLFIDEEGKPMNFISALVGGRAVGAPGVLRMLEDAHRWHGKLPWRELFVPAIETARAGFEVTPRLHRLLRRDPLFRAMPGARALFYEGGQAKAVGTVHKNPALAQVLETIAEGGADAFYEGELAEKIVAAVQAAQKPPLWVAGLNKSMLDFGLPFGSGLLASEPAAGLLTKADLAAYESKVRKPVCIRYRAYKVCGHPPPTSGGVTTLQILGILSAFELSKYEPNSVEAAHLLAEAGRLAFADRAAYLGDPDFVEVPVERLLDPGYLAKRAAMIDITRARAEVSAGKLAGLERTPDTSPSLPSTSHFTIADSGGRWITMTTSVENVFGSRLVVAGMVLNNQLTDFSFVPERGGKPVANAVAPGKRPRSSMSPILVFDGETGAPVAAVGSAGGSRIIGDVLRSTVAMLDWGLDPQAALALPHVLNRGRYTEIENEGWPGDQGAVVKAGLEKLGHTVKVVELNSGLHAMMAKDGVFLGGVDPRREGRALGGVRTASVSAGGEDEGE